MNWRKLMSGSESRRLLSNFMSLSSLRGLEMLLPLITLPYLVRVLGLEKYGMLAFALSLATYSSAFIQYGFNVTAVRELARARDDHHRLSQIVSVVLTISVSFAILALFILSVLTISVERFNLEFWLYTFSFMFIVSQALFPVWFFQGMAEMKYMAMVNVVSKIVAVCGILFFVKNEQQYVLVPLINFSCSFIALLIALRLIFKRFNITYSRPKSSEICATLRTGSDAFISQLAPSLYNNSSIFMLGLFTNPAVVGIYVAATRVIEVFSVLGNILSATFLPYLARKTAAIPRFNKLMLCSGLVLTLLCMLSSEIVAMLLFSADNLIVATYIRYLAPGIVALFAISAFGTNSLMLLGQDRIVRNGALYVSVLFFFIALVIVPALGIIGSCLTIVGARVSMALYYSYFYRKYAN
ncbi:polysaccharide transporter, PST family [Arsukibacterium tuosuense]|uniref:Polysaccharide transporter, PST family n=2 Tax=Arsukibacterium tuosuense TaxID=1323745 RepID=A0A285IW14_9GAMM|nr:polysaccharide transporter, PST family [Arsukibacterium tuosuense]